MNKHLNAIRKAGFSSLFTPTKAIRRVRAIAADRTRASLTGGCSGAGNFRIYTEFCSAEGEPGRLGNRAGQRPLPKGLWDRRGQGSRATARGVAAQGVAGRRVRRRVGPIAVDDGDASASSKSAGPCKTRSVKNRVVAHLSSRSTWRARNSQRSVNASHCSFTALAHNSQRGGAALLIRTSAEIEQPHRVTPG